MNLADIDFAARYREHVRRAGRSERTAEYWNGRAPAFSQWAFETPYVRQFVSRMDLGGCATLLDVGCGPGTIGLSVAGQLEHVYGLDYSPGMLAAFAENARRRGLTRVTPILRAWDADWRDVPVCDIVVASRSTAVSDLEAALRMLDAKARRRVYITYPAEGRFAGDEICLALGRPDRSLPDYLSVIGILHHLRLQPTLDYLPGENRFAKCVTFDDFRAKVAEVIEDLTPEDDDALRRYFDANRHRIGRETMRWAFVSWDATASATAAQR